MKHVVFYDAQCPFCYQIKRVFSKFDWLDQIKWVSVQAIEQSGKYPYLEGRNTLDEIHMLTKEGEIKKGFFTIRRLMLVLPPVSLIGLLLYLPGLHLIGTPLYQWFSSHRYQWFGRYEYPRYS
ncbi:thiol-disulfide oxidoreductase DCC family protein [Halobacillus sp. B29]|uniref:thiol-disulfide oxidoreductase DCC family protein n=1 Tax=Halobacillus sp. B29 TaxID=3457432 RepID=UPI003FCCBD8A